MPLVPPALDDRSYDDLVSDMLANIPAHTPEWSNPQPGDPGRTLIELFAWLADTILYRANLIPERQRIAFLKLIGQTMNPAAAAHGLVALALDPSVTAPRGLIAGATVTGASATGANAFESLDEVDLLPVTAQAYVKTPVATDATNGTLLAGLRQLYNLPATPSGYQTTPVFANGLGSTDGVDLIADTIDGCLWLALFGPKGVPPATVAAAIGGANGQRLLSVGFVPALTVTDPLAQLAPPAGAQVTWQMSAPPQDGNPVFTTLKPVGGQDTTNGLTQAGIIRLVVPQTADIGAPANDVRVDAQAGVGPKPPRIDDPDLAARLVTWVRLSAQSALSVSWLGINVVNVDQRATSTAVVVGVSDGTAGQQFALSQRNVDPATFQLEIDMPGLGYVLWQPVDDLAVLQGPSWNFVLDPEAGTVTFGNQLQGAIVPLGRRIRVRQMRAGGGAAGNLPAGSLTAIAARDASGRSVGQIAVVQPVATTGGADAETLAQAQQRIPAQLRHQGRAVTAGDYESLCRDVPGATVARVDVLPLFFPQTRSSNVPGVVSVMVIPPKDGVLNPCPRADRPLLSTVSSYIDQRRPAAAEVYVIGTDYVGLGISVGVEVRAGFGLLQVSQAVETALRTYLWPIAPGGTDNTGWPLGRGVRSLELEVVVSKVAGVVEVDGLNLFGVSASGGYQRLTTDASGRSELTLQSWQLVEVLQVVVAAGPDGTTVPAADSLTPPASADTSVAVPVVPRVC